MYSPTNPDPCMPAVPPLYPMYPIDQPCMPEPFYPKDPCVPSPMYPIEPPYAPEPVPMYPYPMEPPCMPEPVPMYPYPMEPPCMPEPEPMPYPPNEMPYMCPLMSDPLIRHCVELCLKRCRGSLYNGKFPLDINEIGNLNNDFEENFTPQNSDEIVE